MATAKAKAKKRTCRVCGCTDEKACLTACGPCFWVTRNLCSGCATAAQIGRALAKRWNSKR